MTEEPRASEVILAPEDCPYRGDYDDTCHHKKNDGGVCNYPHDFPNECPLERIRVLHWCESCKKFRKVDVATYICMNGILEGEFVVIGQRHTSCDKYEALPRTNPIDNRGE